MSLQDFLIIAGLFLGTCGSLLAVIWKLLDRRLCHIEKKLDEWGRDRACSDHESRLTDHDRRLERLESVSGSPL